VFSGNGSTTVFNLSKPPFTVHQVLIGTNKQKTGVFGVDTLGVSGFVALVNKQAQTITFQGPPVSGTNNITVTYTYEDAVIAQCLSPDSRAQYGRWFDRKVNDSNLTSTTAAKNRGLAELTKYAFKRTILKFSTSNIYIPVGSIVLFTSQRDSYSQQPFTVQTLKTLHRGAGLYTYEYTAGAYNPTLIDHLRNVHKSINRSSTTSNVQVIVTYDLALFDTITYSESVTVTPRTTTGSKYGSSVYGTGIYV
jgi:hypothetical protein